MNDATAFFSWLAPTAAIIGAIIFAFSNLPGWAVFFVIIAIILAIIANAGN